MSDPRLNSCHLDFPRRQDYRRCRDALLEERGWLTNVAEHVHDLVGDREDWPIDPHQILPGTRYLLHDLRTDCRYLLATGLNSLGRLADNDIVFEDLIISRRHCVLLVHVRGGCELHDTASRNGTFVNGVRVRRPVRLTSGDGIRIGDRLLQFLDEKDDHAVIDDEDHPLTMVQ